MTDRATFTAKEVHHAIAAALDAAMYAVNHFVAPDDAADHMFYDDVNERTIAAKVAAWEAVKEIVGTLKLEDDI